MGKAARVESIDTLKTFRTALCKFAEAANIALADAEGEMQRTHTWLETEGQTYWQGQIRRRANIVARAKEAVRMKKLFKNAAGSRDSAVDEERALAVATRQLEEAEQKLVNVRKYARLVQREISLYQGSVQRFATSVQCDIPVAVSKLDNMVAVLESYLALSAPSEAVTAGAGLPDDGPTMSRGEGIAIEQPPAQTPTPDQTDKPTT
jgi:hypothetical protein